MKNDPNFDLTNEQIKLIIDNDETRAGFLELLELPSATNIKDAAKYALSLTTTHKQYSINEDKNLDIVIVGIEGAYAVWSDATDWIGAFENISDAERFVLDNLL
jgi:hypothetical protein